MAKAIEAKIDAGDERQRRDQAMQFLGGAIALDRLKEHLSSQVIGALMTIEEQKLYLDYDFETFADFLDRSDLSGMSKSQFYRLRELYLKEGPEAYDLFASWKIPLRTRKLLAAGDIEIDGNEVVIGGQERVSLGESKTIKAIIENLIEQRIGFAEDLAGREVMLKAQTAKLEKVQGDYAELLEEVSELRSMDDLFAELTTLVKLLGYGLRDMDEEERRTRAVVDLPLLAEQFRLICGAYGHIGLEFAAWKEKADERWQTLLAEKLANEPAIVTDEDNF